MWEDLSVLRLQKHDLTRYRDDANPVMGFHFARQIERFAKSLGFISYIRKKRLQRGCKFGRWLGKPSAYHIKVDQSDSTVSLANSRLLIGARLTSLWLDAMCRGV